jgi:hypothetical protein
MGGTYDPKTNQIVWEFKVPLEEQLAFYKGHPPGALDGLGCRAISLPDHEFDGHGEPVNAIFEVSCRCGSKRFAATGWVNEDNDIGPPVTLFCDECEEEYEIFDEAQHGYEALLAAIEGGVLGGREDDSDHPDDFPDPEPPYEVVVRFEFASDVLGGDKWKGQEQDAFTWITVLARKPDGTLETLIEWECG